MTDVPSPARSAPIKLKDSDVGFSYIEFPEDTFFMESLAQNKDFRPNVAYIPVQRFVNNQEESHLYEISAETKTAKHIAGPIAAPDGSIDVTVFGSALTSGGMLYLCAFNRNSIIGYDLNKLPSTVEKMTCTIEVPDLASPNDVSVDPDNESVLYVVGGIFRRMCVCCCVFSNSAYGHVYKVDLSNNNMTEVSSGLKTLAGVEKNGGKLWVAQLFNVVTFDTITSEPKVVWKGNDVQEQVWLADNIDIFDDGTALLCPAYSTAPASTVEKVMNRAFVMSTVLFCFQVITALKRRERLRAALRDPEVSLSFSNTYIQEGVDPAPVRIILLQPNQDAVHLEIDLVQTRAEHGPREIASRDGKQVLGQRHFFNEQVTHAAHLKGSDGTGYVACVNFEQPRILLLNDRTFRDKLSTPAVVE